MNTLRLKGLLDLVSTVAVIVAAGAVVWTFLIKGNVHPSAPEPRPQVEQVSGLRLDAKQVRNVLGNGPVAIVEFSDFQCPFCAKHAQVTLPEVKRTLVDSGVARYVALNFPLEAIHPLATLASEAAECAGRQGRYWEMHARLFAPGSALTRADVERHALAIGVDLPVWTQCVDAHETLEQIRVDQAEGQRLGVSGTPSFFVGTVRPDGGIDLVRRVNGAASMETLAAQAEDIGS